MTAAQIHRHNGTKSPKGLLFALALALPLGLAAGTAFRGVSIENVPQAFQVPAFQPQAQAGPELEPQTVEIPAHEVRYRPGGSFSLNVAVAAQTD